MKETLNVVGTITIFEGNKKEKILNQFHNEFLNVGKQDFFNFLIGNNEIEQEPYKFLSIGTGTKQTDLDDLGLEQEQYRKEISDFRVYPDRLLIDVYIETFEANFNWTEMGLIRGGTQELNTGKLYNRAVVNETKNPLKSVTVSWEIKIN